MEYIGRIIELIQKLFVWWVIVDPWEQGLRVRGGKRIKLLASGVHFRFPFYDQIFVQTTKLRVVSLPPQTVSTKDGKTLTIACAIGYSISDVLKIHQTLFQPESTICNIVMGFIADFVARNELPGCSPSIIEQAALVELVKKEYGIKFEYLMVTGYAVVKTYRLIQDGHWMPDNVSTSIFK